MTTLPNNFLYICHTTALVPVIQAPAQLHLSLTVTFASEIMIQPQEAFKSLQPMCSHKCYSCVSIVSNEVIKNAGSEGFFRLASIGALISSCTHECLHDQSIVAATLQASDGTHMTSMVYSAWCHRIQRKRNSSCALHSMKGY